jgi:alkanesulfonate monooxygenase SsuD/methylene tetrahydromethanopterin reductase-like flavin-dependent oxidoreductase (luciferase family)
MQDGSIQIRVDIRVPVGVPMSELVEFVKRCEDAGFYGVGIHDHHHSGRDAYVALALAASSTGRIRLYPATSNTVTRHPLVLAALANRVGGSGRDSGGSSIQAAQTFTGSKRRA